MVNDKPILGVIGGSGLYQMDGIEDVKRLQVSTPFGEPSDALICGTVNDMPCAFLPRHGVGHRYTPSEVNYRANIWARKSVGVRFSVCLPWALCESGSSPDTWSAPHNLSTELATVPQPFSVKASLVMFNLGTPSKKSFGKLCLRALRKVIRLYMMVGATFVLRDRHFPRLPKANFSGPGVEMLLA